MIAIMICSCLDCLRKLLVVSAVAVVVDVVVACC